MIDLSAEDALLAIRLLAALNEIEELCDRAGWNGRVLLCGVGGGWVAQDTEGDLEYHRPTPLAALRNFAAGMLSAYEEDFAKREAKKLLTEDDRAAMSLIREQAAVAL